MMSSPIKAPINLLDKTRNNENLIKLTVPSSHDVLKVVENLVVSKSSSNTSSRPIQIAGIGKDNTLA